MSGAGPYDPENIFARIIRGEIPCTKVYEDDHVLAFEDIQPQAPVHVLVLPKGPYVTLDDLAARGTDEEIAAWIRAVGRVVEAKGLAQDGYRVLANAGRNGHQEVPHLHLHVVGGRDLGGMIRRPR